MHILALTLHAPATAVGIIKAVENIARESIDEVHKAPFGWTKAFDIRVKGHPLAENAKVLTRQQQQQRPLDKKGVGAAAVAIVSIGGRYDYCY